MNTKLTLSMDKETIQKIKEMAKKKEFALSEIVERFFRALLESEQNETGSYTPLVRELSGIIRLEQGTDLKEEYANYLVGKYRK
jgi:hemerythrin superfamily protein